MTEHRYNNPHRSERVAVRRQQVRILCALGTLAHNRSFTKQDAREYLYTEGIGASIVDRAVDAFIKKSWLERLEHGRFYPTKRGWRAIEVACRMPAGSR